MNGEVERLERERDFYRGLLQLSAQEEVEPFLDEALRLIVTISGAARGYIELHDSLDAPGQAPRFWTSYECTPENVADIRKAISFGIVGSAIATGKTIHTQHALSDVRFRRNRSVEANRIGAVLCAPVGVKPTLGVVYLQNELADGPFPDEAQKAAELFATQLAAMVDRLLADLGDKASDPTLPFRERLDADGLIGRSQALADALRQASLVAPLDLHVLLTGPSGTGKTALAQVIAQSGPRRSRPFVELNCAALPETLLESELFGAMQGSHSTASRRSYGKVHAAEGGTLFLDEVAELSLASQAKLLQLLQSKTYYPLGASQPEVADVRIIAATNVDLMERVGERTFREDLYYRLNIMPIDLPALVHRRRDIGPLSAYLVRRANERHRLPPMELAPSALRAAEFAEWPGNVRQLGNALEAAAIRAAGEGVTTLERRHLFPEVRTGDEVDLDSEVSFQEATRRFQEKLLLESLNETGWNVAESARRLDLARSHVYNLIKAFGLTRR